MSTCFINRKQFLEPGESVLMISMVKKMQKLTSKKVKLILTNKPKLIYVDPSKLVVKGNIIWSDNSNDLSIQVTSPSQFKVCTVKYNWLILVDEFLLLCFSQVIIVLTQSLYVYATCDRSYSQRKYCLSRMLSNEQCSGKKQLKLSKTGDFYVSFRPYILCKRNKTLGATGDQETVGSSHGILINTT